VPATPAVKVVLAALVIAAARDGQREVLGARGRGSIAHLKVRS